MTNHVAMMLLDRLTYHRDIIETQGHSVLP